MVERLVMRVAIVVVGATVVVAVVNVVEHDTLKQVLVGDLAAI